MQLDDPRTEIDASPAWQVLRRDPPKPKAKFALSSERIGVRRIIALIFILVGILLLPRSVSRPTEEVAPELGMLAERVDAQNHSLSRCNETVNQVRKTVAELSVRVIEQADMISAQTNVIAAQGQQTH